MTSRPIALIAIPVAAFGLGYWVAPKEQLYQQVEHTGFLQVDTSKVLAPTVESLRGENKMLVFAYKGTARVSVKCTMHKKVDLLAHTADHADRLAKIHLRMTRRVPVQEAL